MGHHEIMMMNYLDVTIKVVFMTEGDCGKKLKRGPLSAHAPEVEKQPSRRKHTLSNKNCSNGNFTQINNFYRIFLLKYLRTLSDLGRRKTTKMTTTATKVSMKRPGFRNRLQLVETTSVTSSTSHKFTQVLQ